MANLFKYVICSTVKRVKIYFLTTDDLIMCCYITPGECLQTSKACAEARLEALRSANISVDEWLTGNADVDNDADGSSTHGRLSPAASAHSDLSDRVMIDSC